jgi:Sap, sulfolipid-1-addressing protein
VFEIFVLAVLSAFWPTLLLVDVLAFQAPKPERILLAFLAGGLLTTLTIGSLIVFGLQGTAIFTRSKGTTDPALNFAIGLLALLSAYVLERMRRRPPKPKPEPETNAGETKHTPFVEQAIARGAPLAFVAGILLNIIPGVFPVIGLKDIAELEASNAESFALILAFYVIMFMFVEIPIVGLVVAPEWTQARVRRFNTWLGENKLRVLIWILVVGGVYLVVRGVLQVV